MKGFAAVTRVLLAPPVRILGIRGGPEQKYFQVISNRHSPPFTLNQSTRKFARIGL